MMSKCGLFTQFSLGTVYALKIGKRIENNRQDTKFYKNGFSWHLCVFSAFSLPQFEFVKHTSFCSTFWRMARKEAPLKTDSKGGVNEVLGRDLRNEFLTLSEKIKETGRRGGWVGGPG